MPGVVAEPLCILLPAESEPPAARYKRALLCLVHLYKVHLVEVNKEHQGTGGLCY